MPGFFEQQTLFDEKHYAKQIWREIEPILVDSKSSPFEKIAYFSIEIQKQLEQHPHLKLEKLINELEQLGKESQKEAQSLKCS